MKAEYAMSIPPAADAPCEILLSIEERQKSLYNVASIQRALEALHQDGFVVLKDVVDVQHVENLNEYMCQEAEVLVSTKAKPFNQGVNCALSFPGLVDTCHVSMEYSLGSEDDL